MLDLFESAFYVITKAVRKLTFWTALVVFLHLRKIGALADPKILIPFLIFCIFVVSQKMAVALVSAWKGGSVAIKKSPKHRPGIPGNKYE